MNTKQTILDEYISLATTGMLDDIPFLTGDYFNDREIFISFLDPNYDYENF